MTAKRTATDAEVASLATRFRGPILRPGEPEFDEARIVWNSMYCDRIPALIARCTGAADVAAAVDFAREGGWLPAVRGGGHSAPGFSICDGDLMIDLSLMTGVWVDPERRRARVQGGTTWADFDHEAQHFGLATPGGAISHTGVAGLTLGGGYGWLTRKHGLTLDNLRAVEIVTADGVLRIADETQEPDLYWAVRGGGGNFGVVTSFEFQLHPVGPEILGGLVMWRMEEAREVMRAYRDFGRTAPPELGLNMIVTAVPPADPFPTEHQDRQAIMLITCFNGEIGEGEELLRPLREFGAPIFDGIAPIPYRIMQQLLDQGGNAPFGFRSYWKTGFLEELSDDAIETFITGAERATSKVSMSEMNTIYGAANAVDPDGTSFGQRNGRWNHLHVSAWTDPADDEGQIDYARDCFAAMSPFYCSAYTNFMGPEDEARPMDQTQVRRGYSEAGWARLRDLKQRFDPGNLFQRNQNIPPSAA